MFSELAKCSGQVVVETEEERIEVTGGRKERINEMRREKRTEWKGGTDGRYARK